MRIGFLIPCTSNLRYWKDYTECYLYSITLKSFFFNI